jgi:hypothetical protein
MVIDTAKVCTKCKQEKPLTEFYLYGKADSECRSVKTRADCKECQRARTAAHRASGRARELALMRQYGLSLSDFNSLLASQNGACAICRIIGVRWFVDHDHETRIVRGILCQHCNSALGFARDSPVILRACAEYLECSRA